MTRRLLRRLLIEVVGAFVFENGVHSTRWETKDTDSHAFRQSNANIGQSSRIVPTPS